ncbi:unnamed protein product [Didymodactylos carnosus]|uniref:Aurora kinase n=1 Tax=Didymodactylos carnosus TaxID=1234261 RepID=A0A813TJ06_9BILA|nr:unnamed protein product [Didymodactylos carnosus]CAF0819658.1 unnamed protein product [Didymodactylos carnosus]CAF3596053.1 unnamed protein product [Didymodactylos carnosus]CAF3603839.1 unnamed protein product [Didymodactylos carnosus]
MVLTPKIGDRYQQQHQTASPYTPITDHQATSLSSCYDVSMYSIDTPAKVTNIDSQTTQVNQPSKSSRSSKWSIDDFNIGRLLGEGTFSKVILVEEKKTGYLCALKIIKKEFICQYNQEHQLIRELEIHMRLFHKHILRMYDFFYDSERIYIIIEYAPNDTLANYLKRHKQLDNITSATYIYQLTDAIHYCHRLLIMHRDIKPENILLGQFMEIKLADFGLALHCPSSRRTFSCGTMVKSDYMAPEVIESEDISNCLEQNSLLSSSTTSATTVPTLSSRQTTPYEESADLWSLGVIAYELLEGQTPFYDLDVSMTKKRILNCDYSLPDTMNEYAKHFIHNLIKYNRQERLTTSEIVNHKWIEKFAKINFVNETFSQYVTMNFK